MIGSIELFGQNGGPFAGFLLPGWFDIFIFFYLLLYIYTHKYFFFCGDLSQILFIENFSKNISKAYLAVII